MVSKSQIDSFFESDYIAVAGVSRNEKKFGNIIYKELKKLGKNVIPVNPNMEKFDNEKCYTSLDALPLNTKSIVIVTGKEHSDGIFKEALASGFQNIWVQQTSETDYIITKAKQSDSNIICKQCLLMYLEPVKGIHNFHKSINKLFGKYPK